MKRFWIGLILLQFLAQSQTKPAALPVQSLPDAPTGNEAETKWFPTALKRWNLEVFAAHQEGIGWYSREALEYRLNRTWSVKLDKARDTIQGGVGFHFGSLK